MNLVQFFSSITTKVGQKNTYAFEQFIQAIQKVEQDSQSSQQIQELQNEAVNNHKNFIHIHHQNMQTNQKNTQFFQKIAQKSIQAIEELLRNMQDIELEQQDQINLVLSDQQKQKQHVFFQNNDNYQHEHQHLILLNKQELLKQNPLLNKYEEKYKKYTQTSEQKLENEQEKIQQVKLSKLQQLQNNKSAKDILSELQQIHRKRSNEKQKSKKIHRSLNMRTRIIKMNPEATALDREQKKLEAQRKMKANIQFLQSLRMQPNKKELISKEFKNDTQKLLNLKSGLGFRVKKITSSTRVDNYIELSNKIHPSTDTQKQKNSLTLREYQQRTMNSIFMQSSVRLLPTLQKRKGMRPKPFSIYNVYQKSNEVYINSSKQI